MKNIKIVICPKCRKKIKLIRSKNKRVLYVLIGSTLLSVVLGMIGSRFGLAGAGRAISARIVGRLFGSILGAGSGYYVGNNLDTIKCPNCKTSLSAIF